MPQLSHDAITPEQRADEHYEMEVPQVTRRAAYGYPTQTRWGSRRQPGHHHLSEHHHIIDIELQSLPPLALDGLESPLIPPDQTGSTLKRRAKLYSLLEADMKFSHSIQFNAVPDWSSRYISYSNLKKLIYQLEKQLNQANGASAGRKHDDAESSPLLSQSTSWSDNPDQVFAKKLEEELEKVCSFFQLKELEIYGEVDAILKDVEEFEAEHAAGEREGEGHGVRRQSLWARARQQSIFKNFQLPQPRRRRSSTMGTQRTNDSRPRDTEDIQEGDESEEEDAGEGTALTKGHAPDLRTGKWESGKNLGWSTAQHDRRTSVDQNSSAEVRRRPSMAFNDFGDDALQALYDEGITLKKRIVNLYVDVSELRSFVQLNEKGFSKVLKKYDKVLDRNLKSSWIDAHVKPAIIFQSSTMEHMSEHLSRLEQGYASIVTSGDVEAARRALRLHLREHVVWERNTVWREMIGIERKAQAANLGIRQTMLGQDTDPKKARLQGDEEDGHATKEVQTLVGRYRCPKFLLSGTFWVLVAYCAIFAVLLGVRFMDAPEQQNCLALIVFVSSLWATEAIPLFVTSLLVPFLVVILRVVRQDEKPHARLESKAAATYIFAAMWTPVIMLLLGGFTIAAALSKYNIAKMMATFVLSKAGTKPRTVLLTAMGVAMFASMWISNVAAPVLCFSIIQPILRNLPSDSDMSKALILGIALASNMGGAASPIASPQNLIALQNMEPQPGWGIWFFIALPVCIITILLIWLLLLVTFRPGRNTTIIPIRPMKDKFTGIQWFISFVTLATIVLWCVSHQLEGVFGDMGVIAIIPIALFFGTGILTKEDFNNFLWTIIILAAGGLALGKAVNSSGLLTTIAVGITQRVQGLSLYAVTCVFCALIAVVATFISHTVAALIILPLVREVGLGMAEPHPNLLVMASVLMASAAMGLPTSGFPNMTAIMMEDPQTGRRYLQVRHFLTRGVPSSIMAFGVVVSVGYGCMIAVGF
ncbi:low-affinity phosphate transporter [Friedmanniomyces endolithicus]|uniref:Low-affinity phosphate transporter n=1 Tax=Friedmanniomyces endolithicus TaxID=329885 RepID=A0AAN6K005_9PEZI|nr:low-affinity phosphate transporter [Friedmanniomyces endolithicus]KAK0841536.1 low-affinity phosphate transporter [Friedmanniomyces endolithicus]KAK0897753.1 low-affinity phosphate transporter [Friedmanniomyces endolithicus]KAK0957674.1 low-affinity phosphate transporter [Friedmanniomyces endolithicus]